MKDIAVLLTCHNRKEKTVTCLKSFYNSASYTHGYAFHVFLVDDGSTDGTRDLIGQLFPEVHLIEAPGNLFWAGGMRLCWQTAVNSKLDFQSYLLINDDISLHPESLDSLFADVDTFSMDLYVLIGSTYDVEKGEISYGGRKLTKTFGPESILVLPNGRSPQFCDLGNANIMLVSGDVVRKIGVLSDKYTHGIADYDYTLRAKSIGAIVCIASRHLAHCTNDHGPNWLSSTSTLKQRIKYLYDVKGLAYYQYMYFIKAHFPMYVPIAYLKLWVKTLLPFLWDKLKR